MFGVKPRRGLASSFLPGKQVTDIKIKEQFDGIANSFEENLEKDYIILIGNDYDMQNAIEEDPQLKML